MRERMCSACGHGPAAYCEQVRAELNRGRETWEVGRVVVSRELCRPCGETSTNRLRRYQQRLTAIIRRHHCDFCVRPLSVDSVVVELQPLDPPVRRRRLGIVRVFHLYRSCTQCAPGVIGALELPPQQSVARMAS